jgi:uncharacterized protein YjbI with pentapeptide repeats
MLIEQRLNAIAMRGRIGAVAFILLIALFNPVPVQAQGDPRSNVNLIGMTPDPADFPDIRYRQQNEPACAIRPGDSACIICAYNDYRAVDLDIGFGDSWQGVSQSCDAGDTWRSRLAPGYPGDLDAENIPAKFAADPRLAAIPGMAIFNFIAGFRDTNVGVLAIQHWLEVNKEDSDHYEPGRVTYFADEGTSGRFLDKPDMLAILDPPGQQTDIPLDTVMENPELGKDGVISGIYPSGTLYVAYAVFTGTNSVKVLVKTSADWGRTWRNQALKLSEDQNQVSGISLTAVGNKVLAVWRRQGDGNDPDSIIYSVITNDGKKATKGEVLANICAFDQPTLDGSETDFDIVTFRTNDFPWTANDGENFYVFYSDRERVSPGGACQTDAAGNPNGKPRIVMHHSTLSGQANWTNYGPIDQTADANTFQFMPTAFGANGDVRVAWYDTRRDPSDPLALPFVADYDAGQFLVNRTVDVFTTSITMNGDTPVIPEPVRASQFSILVSEEEKFETEALFANKKLFAKGKASFLGDYIAMAAREYRRNDADTAWVANASQGPLDNEDFFVAWTDNRDVRGVISQISDATPYSYDAAGTTGNTPELKSDDQSGAELLLADAQQDAGPPRDFSQTAEGIDGTDTNVPGFCVPGEDRTRDANIYGSLIKDRVRMYAPNPSKPLSGLQRAFPVVITNSDELNLVGPTPPKQYDLTIIPGDCLDAKCQASFRQTPLFESPVFTEQVTVPAKSSIARTVFVAGDQTPIKIEARDEGGNLLATIQLANAPQFRDPENCKTNDCTVASNELHNLELKTVDVHLLDLLTPGDELAALPILSSRPDDVAEEDWADASSLVDWAVAGGCCDGEEPPSLGSVIEFAVENLEDETVQIDDVLDNASLLNAALLNASLLNASLLNASLLNASLLNASLLNTTPTDLSILDPELVNAAISGGCCFPELEETYGNIVVWAYNNPEYSDPDGINASLLNAALLNASLLNASLLNASLLNASLLNASLLNASLLNASLLNASLLNASLLNTSPEEVDNLLNTDLLNASLLNPTMVALALEGGCCEGSTEPSAVDVIIYAVGHPEVINASLLNASLLNASLLNASLLNASLLNASLLNASLLNANLIEGELSNASLLNASLLNADLINASLLNASLLNASLLNEALSSDEPITYDDYTYPITNNGNVTTAIDADISINAPMVTAGGEEVMDVIGTKLVTWTANATPTVVDCVERVQLNTRVQSITSPDGSFEVADINDPFAGQTSAVVAAGETVFVTLRVIGTPSQLKNVRVSGFTASSQAANCYDTVNGPQCDDQLNLGIEQIVFAQPIITLLGTTPVSVEAGDAYIDAGATAVAGTEDLTSAIVTVNPVNTGVPGTYTVTYNVASSSGTVAEEVTRTVIVEDTTAPSIALIGANPQVIEVGGAYEELGAIASDPVFGDVSGSIIIDASGVDTSKVGSYTVTYNVTDSRGNAATQATRTVNVVDTTAPVINLAGEPTVTVEVGATYSDAGATATDVGDDDATLTNAIVTVNPVDTGKVDSYTVTYNVTDSQGNAATQVTRTVNVVDTTAPVINLAGEPTVTVEVGGTYSDAGATATDVGDDDVTLTNAIVTVNPVDTGKVDSYTVTYNVTDSQGNAATQVTRTVNVVDTTPPVITLLGSTPVTVEVGGTYADAGATATDVGDGDLTLSLVTVNPVDTGKVDSYTVTYNVTDSQGNAATQVTRTVNVVDTTPPVITLLGSTPVTVEVGGTYTDAGATATDIGDGDLTLSIVPSSNVNTAVVGNYSVTYNVSDIAGNSAAPVTRIVNVVDTTPPVITLLGTTPVTVEVGGTYADAGATATDIGDGDLTLSIVPSSNVNTAAVGNYSVTYNVSDIAGNAAAPVTRIVNVVDTTPPVITLIGAASITVEGGTTYTDAGATATDIGDGDLTGAIVVGNTVNTAVVGSYTVTYNVSDAEGNAATQVTRTVNVVDTTAPVITLLGSTPVTVEAGTVYSDDGATATDTVDGNLTASIVVTSNVKTAFVGGYTVTYNVSDSAGNAATAVTRTVNVIDTTSPIIVVAVPPNCSDDGTIVNCDFTATGPEGAYVDLSGIVTATDLGQPIDVSCSTVPPSTLVGATLPTILPPGDYTVLCTASDGSSVAVTVQISVDVVDVDPPELTVPIGAVTVVADPLTGTAVVDYSDQISASDNVDGNVTITCDPPSGSTFATGETTVTCTASDDGPNANGGVNTSTATFTVIVNDEAGPIVTAPNVDIKSWYFNPSDPDWARIPIADYTSDVFAEDVVDGPISSNSIICERDDTPEDPLLTADDFEFSDEPYSITCTAKDSALNTGSASFSLTVNYLYDINLVPPKGRVRAGSSVPLDWSYSEVDEFGVTRVVDSSAVDVRVAWTKMIESPPGEPQCVTPDTTDPSTDGTSGVGDDSGFSDFRYSASNDTWQFSWQTPSTPGYFKVSVSPPGANVTEAWECINLR